MKNNIFGKVAYFFVTNSKLSVLLLVTILLWGSLSYWFTPKQYNPDIVAPAFQITVQYQGASLAEVHEHVTKPLENIMSDISGVDEVLSQSYNGGTSVVVVKFFIGQPLEESKIKLSQKIRDNMDLKTFGISEPLIKTIDPDFVPVMTVALNSKQLQEVSLRKVGFDVADKLKNIKNIANISVHGGKQRVLEILIDIEKINLLNISLEQIKNAINTNNVIANAGNLEINNKLYPLFINGSIENLEQAKKIVVLNSNNQKIYLEDLAQVSFESLETNDFVRFVSLNADKQKTVFLSLAKKKGSNVSAVTNEVEKYLEKINLPADINYQILRNEGKVAEKEVNGLMFNLLQAIIIVAIILLLFLNLRSALIVSIAIPLTLLAVFITGLMFGKTINRITLFALILSLGLLVDNATVIIENIVRHIKLSKNKKDKPSLAKIIANAVSEVGIGLFLSTVTTLFAFYPMAFVTGMMGPYMGPIPFFVPAALIASLIFAFTLNSWLASVLLKGFYLNKIKNKKNKFLDLKDKLGSFVYAKYEELLNIIFNSPKKQKVILLFSVILLLFSVLLPVFKVVPFRMLPKANKEQFYIYLDLPKGTRIEQTNNIVEKIENFLLNNKEILNIQSFIGQAPIVDFNGLFKGTDSRNNEHQATLRVNLIGSDEMELTSENFVINLRPRIYKLLETEPDARIQLIEDPPGPPVMATMLLKIIGNDKIIRENIAHAFKDKFWKTKEVVDVNTSVEETVVQFDLVVDKIKANEIGVSAFKIIETLRTLFVGEKIGLLHLQDFKEPEYLFIKIDSIDKNSLNDLERIYVSSNSGQKVPLSELIIRKEVVAPSVLYKDNRREVTYISAELGQRSVVYAVIDVMFDIFSYKKNEFTVDKVSLYGINLIHNKTKEMYRLEWGGEWELTLDVFRDLGLAMIIAIFLIYLILVAQFRSYIKPLLIMGTIPLALIGVLPGYAILFFITGLYFNATSMIGVIALAGIVVNNAIIYLEYLELLLSEGENIKTALIKTGVTRMRPILLTSATTVLGSLTIVGDPVWAGLGWSIILGLSFSAVLTLLILPILYNIVFNKK